MFEDVCGAVITISVLVGNAVLEYLVGLGVGDALNPDSDEVMDSEPIVVNVWNE